MNSKAENILVKELARTLAPKVCRVWTHKKPSSSLKFRTEIGSRIGYIPILQPEIDLCMLLTDGRLVAVEVKLFQGSAFTYKTPFYEGIGQALALHRFGFDHAALWFLFSDGADIDAYNRYGAEAWTFVRNDLCLPLDFSYVAVIQNEAGYRFDVMQYTDHQKGVRLLPIDDPSFNITWKHSNPIRFCHIQKELRATLQLWLGI